MDFWVFKFNLLYDLLKPIQDTTKSRILPDRSSWGYVSVKNA